MAYFLQCGNERLTGSLCQYSAISELYSPDLDTTGYYTLTTTCYPKIGLNGALKQVYVSQFNGVKIQILS